MPFDAVHGEHTVQACDRFLKNGRSFPAVTAEHGLGELLAVHESLSPRLVQVLGRCGRLRFGERLAGRDHWLDPIAHGYHHAPVGAQVRSIPYRPMARDDTRAGVGQLERPVGGGNDALDRPTGGEIDERIAAGEVQVAHVQHIGLAEMDDGIAMGVAGGTWKARISSPFR